MKWDLDRFGFPQAFFWGRFKGVRLKLIFPPSCWSHEDQDSTWRVVCEDRLPFIWFNLSLQLPAIIIISSNSIHESWWITCNHPEACNIKILLLSSGWGTFSALQDKSFVCGAGPASFWRARNLPSASQQIPERVRALHRLQTNLGQPLVVCWVSLPVVLYNWVCPMKNGGHPWNGNFSGMPITR